MQQVVVSAPLGNQSCRVTCGKDVEGIPNYFVQDTFSRTQPAALLNEMCDLRMFLSRALLFII